MKTCSRCGAVMVLLLLLGNRTLTLLCAICRCREEDGTLKIQEVKAGPLSKKDLLSEVSFFLSFSIAQLILAVNTSCASCCRSDIWQCIKNSFRSEADGMAVETSAKTVIQCGLKYYKNNKRGNIHLQIVLKMQIDTSGNRK